MALPPLNKNSGKFDKEFRIGPIIFMVSVAEDPSGRYWSHQCKEGTEQTDYLFCFHRIKKEYDDKRVGTAYALFIGPMLLYMFHATKAIKEPT